MNTITLFRRPRLAFFEIFFGKTGWKNGSPAWLRTVSFVSFMFYACSFSSLFGIVVSLNVFLMFLRAEKTMLYQVKKVAGLTSSYPHKVAQRCMK